MDALQYNKELVAFESTSSLSNAAISDYVEDTLRKLGFKLERLQYDDANGVTKVNVIGKRGERLPSRPPESAKRSKSSF